MLVFYKTHCHVNTNPTLRVEEMKKAKRRISVVIGFKTGIQNICVL